MATTSNNPSTHDKSYFDPRIKKEDEQALKDYLDINKQINDVLKSQSGNLHEIFDFTKDIGSNVFKNFVDRRKILDLIKEQKASEKAMLVTISGIHDETARRGMESVLQSITQRRKGYEADLDLLNKIRMREWMPLLWVFSKAYHLFKDIDKAAWEFRKAMGLTRESSKDVKDMAQKIAIEFMHVGVTFEGAFKSVLALSEQMGSVHLVTKDLVKTTSILQSQLGIAEEDSAGFFRNMAAVSKSTMESQEMMAYLTADLSQAAGTKLPQVMKDIATRSNTTLAMMSRIPSVVMKSAIELRKMGTSLDEVANSSHQILQFSSNIADEMEASVLLGRSINLQRARELAYRRDLEGSTKEILRITKSINFENMDVFQQEAFAKATGKTVEELLRMVVAERQWEAARRDPTLAGKVEKYEALKRANESIAKSSAENLKYMIEQRSNQERITAISQRWNQLVSRLAQFFLPLIDGTLKFIIDHFDAIRNISITIGVIWAANKAIMMTTSGFVLDIRNALSETKTLWGGISALFTRFLPGLSNLGKGLIPFLVRPLTLAKLTLGSILGSVAAIGSAFAAGWGLGKFLTQFEVVNKTVSEFMASIMSLWYQFPTTISDGIFAIGHVMFTALTLPFTLAYNAIMSVWGGQSPSLLGMNILEGILSVGSMIYDALINPFKCGFEWIAKQIEKIPILGNMFQNPIETRIASSYVPAIQVTPNGTTISGLSDTTQDTKKGVKGGDVTTLDDVSKLLNILIDTVNKKNMDVYLDGSLISTLMGRGLEFKGSYGTNK